MKIRNATGLVRLLMLALTCLALFLPASPSKAGMGNDPENVFVEVSWLGFNVRLTAGGWIGFVGPEPRDDLKHALIEPGLAFKTIDSLLALGFFWTLDQYPSRNEHLSVAQDGTISLDGSAMLDGGQIDIRLKVGAKEKRVRIELPAAPAASSFMPWFFEFEALASKALFRG